MHIIPNANLYTLAKAYYDVYVAPPEAKRGTCGRPVTVDAKERAQKIIDMRVGGMTHQEIGDSFGISRERTRQIIRKYEYLSHGASLGRHPSEGKIERMEAKHRAKVKLDLRQLFTSEYFQRAEVLRITGWADNGSDIELCERLHDEFRIVIFGPYGWCNPCRKVKSRRDFAVKSFLRHGECRQCNSTRCTEWMKNHPGYTKRKSEWAKSTGKGKLYTRRSAMKKQGRINEIPPLDTPLPLPSLPAWWTRAASMTKEQLSARAKKGWESRKKRQAGES